MQSQNTKQVEVLRNIWNELFWQEEFENLSKTGWLYALKERRGEMNHNE